MKTEQRRKIINRFNDVINNDRIALIKGILNQRTRFLTVVLDDIYQPQNASAIIRTCECLGIQELHAIQDRNEYKFNKMVVKGANKWTDIKCFDGENGRTECIEQLLESNYKLVAMTLSKDCIPLEQLPVNDKLAICFGCEETGISQKIEDAADYKVKIPIHGFTQSYNVSVSAGISLYYLINKIKDANQNWQLTEEEKEELLIEWLSKSTPAGKSLLEKYKESVY